MGRPEIISCERCGTSVPVKAKGPVARYCTDCRKEKNSSGKTRPKVVACERCGAFVTVKARGPVARFCRGGCRPTTKPHRPRDTVPVAAAAKPKNGPLTPHTMPTPRSTPVAPADPTPTEPERPDIRVAVAAAAPPLVAETRLDVAADAHRLAVIPNSPAWYLRMRRWRNAAAIIAWVVLLAIVGLVFLLGARPSPPDFSSFGRFIT